jgi:hypothetical protein
MPDHSPSQLSRRVLGYGVALLSGALLGAGAHALLVPHDASTSTSRMALSMVEAPLCPPVPSCQPPLPAPSCWGRVRFHATQGWEIGGGPSPVTMQAHWPRTLRGLASPDGGSVPPPLHDDALWRCGAYSLLAKSIDDPKRIIPISISVIKDKTGDVYLP